MNSYDILKLCTTLRQDSNKLRAAFIEAEANRDAAWRWYEALSDEEYKAQADEAEAKVAKADSVYTLTGEKLDACKTALDYAEKLWRELSFLEEC